MVRLELGSRLYLVFGKFAMLRCCNIVYLQHGGDNCLDRMTLLSPCVILYVEVREVFYASFVLLIEYVVAEEI